MTGDRVSAWSKSTSHLHHRSPLPSSGSLTVHSTCSRVSLVLQRVSTCWHFGLDFILMSMGWVGEAWWEVDPSWELGRPQLCVRGRQRLGAQHAYVNKWLWKAFFQQSTPSLLFFLPSFLSPTLPLFLPSFLPSSLLSSLPSLLPSFFPSHLHPPTPFLSLFISLSHKNPFIGLFEFFLERWDPARLFLSICLWAAVHLEDDWQDHKFRDTIKGTTSYGSWKSSVGVLGHYSSVAIITLGFKPGRVTGSLRWTSKHPNPLASLFPGCHARLLLGQALLAELMVGHGNREKSSVQSIYIHGWRQKMNVSPREREGSTACGQICSPLSTRHGVPSLRACSKLKMFPRQWEMQPPSFPCLIQLLFFHTRQEGAADRHSSFLIA